MDAPLPKDVQLQLRRLQEAVNGLEVHLLPMLDVSPQELEQLSRRTLCQPFTFTALSPLFRQMPPHEQAQLHLTVARGQAAVYALYSRTAGADSNDGSFKKDLERLELYAKKVKKAAYAKELAGSRRTLAIDVAAANRFIDAAVPDFSQDQKAARHQGPVKRKRKDAADEPPSSPGVMQGKSAAQLADDVLQGIMGASA